MYPGGRLPEIGQDPVIFHRTAQNARITSNSLHKHPSPIRSSTGTIRSCPSCGTTAPVEVTDHAGCYGREANPATVLAILSL